LKRVRVIPVLTIEEQSLVKTVKFTKPNYIGDPLNAIKIFNDKYVDEIVVLDISASKKNQLPNYELIQEMAEECFIPLAYGGGISNLEQAKKLFSIGIEKVILNSTLLKDPSLITEIVRIYGNQSVIASIDIKKSLFQKKNLYGYSGTKKAAQPLFKMIDQFIACGVGELLVHSIDLDGTRKGYDLKMLSDICTYVEVPVIACGGANNIQDFYSAIKQGNASAVAAGSMFMYLDNTNNSILINYPSQADLKRELYTKL